ncbi:MAG: transcription antitermination protein NusB [Bacteroidales bacterium]|nr:transcription antitermination protein NusB [Bacteroidales bacterium]
MNVSLHKFFTKFMLNRRILRIKAFKVLYSSVLSGNMSLAQAESQLELSCEAVRDLYIYMLGIVSPLTQIARERIEVAKAKFNPTEEERNPNMKFADNALARLLDEDVDFQKVFGKKKFSWMQYDPFLKKVMTSVASKEYYKAYMSAEGASLEQDCRLFTRIFEEEFVDSEDLENILEDRSLYWNDDLAYALTFCCRTLKSLAKGEKWSLMPLYQSEMIAADGIESDKLFVRKLLQASFAGYEKYSAMVAESVVGWEKERLFSTDVVLIVMGLAEAVSFPSIPVKVTINEYVEISKFYGTPKSRSFVNGLLDRLIQKLQDEGQIVKQGKGLL